MVGRFPIETWSRPQLEDHFHSTVEELQNAQKKIKEQEKQLTNFNSRFRRNLLERKSRDEQMVDRDKYEDVVKEKQILDMKLKAAKHQLLIYTAPSARAATASAMTGRSTFRQPPSTWRQQRPPISAVSIDRGGASIMRKKSTEGEKLQLGTDEKLMIVRLNRSLKNKNEQISQLQYTIEKLKEQLSAQRSGNVAQQSRISTSSSTSSNNNRNGNEDDEAALSDVSSSRHSENSEDSEEVNHHHKKKIEKEEEEEEERKKKKKTTRISNSSASQKSISEKGDRNQKMLADQLKIAENDLQLLRNECEVLKNANERLIQQSLNKKTEYGARESLEEKKKIITLEEELKEVEKKLKESEQRRKEDHKKFETMRQHYKNQRALPQPPASSDSTLQKTATTQLSEVQDDYSSPPPPTPPVFEPPLRKRSSERGGFGVVAARMRRNDDDLLQKLYDEVADILNSHDIQTTDLVTVGDGKLSMAKWQKMYAELYEELEKVRNMLVVQHDINSKQIVEIQLLQAEIERIKVVNAEKMLKAKEMIEEKQKKIFLLEEQIRTIAYSGQQPINLLSNQISIPSSNSLSTDLSIRLIHVKPSSSLTSKFFFSLEFFDFQLETTPILSPKEQEMDFATIYDVVVSNLLIHYLQTSGITIEMYKPVNDKYQLLGASTISLIPLFEGNVLRKYCSEISVKNIENGEELCVLRYEIEISELFTESFQKFRISDAARKFLPLEIEKSEEENNFEPLTILINRVNGLKSLGKENNFEFCIVYELLSFSSFFTDFSTDCEIQSRRDVMIPKLDTTKELFLSSNISFYLIENIPKQDGVLAMLHLPLQPLCKLGGSIKGIFPMIAVDGTETQIFLDVCIMWKHGVPAFNLGPMMMAPAETPILDQQDPLTPPKRLSKQFEVIPVENAKEEEEEEEEEEKLENHSKYPPSSESSFSSESSILVSPKKTPTIFDYHLPASSKTAKEDEAEDEEIESISAKSSHREEAKIDEPENEPATVEVQQQQQPPTDKESPEQTPLSSESSSTPTTQRSAIIEEEIFAGDLEAEELPVQIKEREKEEIKNLLGALPPIAKPRNLPPITSEDSQASTTSAPATTSRSVIFTEPLHRSIPPSESSSVSSPRRAEKEPVALPEYEGHGVIKSTTKIRSPLNNDEVDPNLKVTIILEQFEIVQYSKLLMKYFENSKVFIDWTFLDFPIEKSQSTVFDLPKTSEESMTLNFKQEYLLTRRQASLLDQWIELSNKVDFTLIHIDSTDEEELAVAQLTLYRNNSINQSIAIDFIDVNGEHLAELQLSFQYSPELLEILK